MVNAASRLPTPVQHSDISGREPPRALLTRCRVKMAMRRRRRASHGLLLQFFIGGLRGCRRGLFFAFPSRTCIASEALLIISTHLRATLLNYSNRAEESPDLFHLHWTTAALFRTRVGDGVAVRGLGEKGWR